MKASTDVGGTFTDYVLLDGKEVSAFKALTTPDASTGILHHLGKHELEEFAHGTTVAVNAIIQREGARVLLFTTKGFRDVVHIGRQSRSELYSFLCTKPQIPLHHIVEVEERTLSDGSVETPLNNKELAKLADEEAGKAEVAVIAFINSYVNPENERLAEQLLSRHFKTVISSHKVRQEIREYERFSTAVMEGYTAPLVRSYIRKLEGLSPVFSIMKYNGGRVWPEYIKAVNMIMSGPAGGVAASEALCRKLGISNAIPYDMGGTSADISAIVGGKPLYTDTVEVTGIPIRTLAMDIESIGAGGGSIAWLDDGGSLKVGPQSAGSTPGPACYDGSGREFTVSDANLLTGVLGDSISKVKLSRKRAREAADRLCQELDMCKEYLSEGVLRVVNNNMVSALKKISVGRGYDPRDFSLISFGGAGPMHSCALAEAMGISGIIVPPMAGAFSALGILSSPVRFDYLRTVLSSLEEAMEIIPGLVLEFQSDLKKKLDKRYGKANCQVSMDMRYLGQGHQLTIPLQEDPAGAFHAQHRALFGFDIQGNPMDVVNVKMGAEMSGRELPLPQHPEGALKKRGTRELYPYGEVGIYHRDFHGQSVAGPCVIEDSTTTIRVNEGWRATLERNDVLWLEVL